MQTTGTLEVNSNTGISQLDGTVLAIAGSGDSKHQAGAATTFLENHDFKDGDQAVITGNSGTLPDGTPAIFITDAQPVSVPAVLAMTASSASPASSANPQPHARPLNNKKAAPKSVRAKGTGGGKRS